MNVENYCDLHYGVKIALTYEEAEIFLPTVLPSNPVSLNVREEIKQLLKKEGRLLKKEGEEKEQYEGLERETEEPPRRVS